MQNLLLMATLVYLVVAGCAPMDPRHSAPNPTAVGAVLGAAYGQALGHNTESTLLGAAFGGVLGSIWGDHQTQRYQLARDFRQDRAIQWSHASPRYYTEPYPATGQWITVPSSYVGSYYVPPHNVFVPNANRSVIVER